MRFLLVGWLVGWLVSIDIMWYRYNHTLLVGAGIGMTPCASILRGALKYRWRKGHNPKTLQFFWTLR